MPTWGERLLDPVVVGAAAAALLVVDLAAATHLHSEQVRCGAERRLPASTLTVTVELDTTVPRAGHDLRATATVSNTTRTPRLLLDAEGVLLAPGTHRPVSWTSSHRIAAVDLQPGSVTTVPVVVHLARCDRGAPGLTPGFYEVAVELVEGDRSGTHRTVSAPRSVVVPP